MPESLGWLILKYIILGVLGTLGLLFSGIMVAAYVSGMARDRWRDRANELSAISERDFDE